MGKDSADTMKNLVAERETIDRQLEELERQVDPDRHPY